MDEYTIHVLSKDILQFVKEKELQNELQELTAAFDKSYHRSFKLGIMGKSGAGKSTLINALCHEYICDTGGIGGVTREVKEINAKCGSMNIRIFDFPGIAEGEKWDRAYIDLYKQYLDRLDLIFWVITVDDRAIMEDEKFYNDNISFNYKLKEKTIFILSKSDNAEPRREWDNHSFMPSLRQKEMIMKNHTRITMDFGVEQFSKVVPISTNYIKGVKNILTYNFDSIYETILFKLGAYSKVSDEIPISTSWAVTKREFGKNSEIMRFQFEEMSESSSKIMEDLRDTLDILKEIPDEEIENIEIIVK